MGNNPEFEALHQRAAAHYLQGNFRAALEEWRRLLTLAPTDHRAIEGARLCEMLSEEGDSISIGFEAHPVDAGPPAAVSQALSAVPDGLDDLDELMDVPRRRAPKSAVLAAVSSAPPRPDNGAIAWDLGYVADLEGDGPELDRIGDPLGIALVNDLGGVATQAVAVPAAVETDDGDDSTAAAELRNRVGQLLSAAQEAYDSGDRDEALGIISRTFILDEANPDALELKRKIESDREDIPAHEVEEDLLNEGPEAMIIEPTAIPDGPVVAARPAVAALVPPEIQLMPEVIDDLPEKDESVALPDDWEALDESGSKAVAEPPARGAAKSSGPGYWLIVVVIALVIVGAGGLTAWKFLGNRKSGKLVANTSVEATVEDPARAGDPAVAGNVEAGAPAPAAEEAGAPGPVDVPALLAQARKAAADGDHAQAVLSYGAVLEVEPDNAEASAGLEQAGSSYRLKLVVLGKQEEAISAFNEGNYREALSFFYRLPDAADNPKVERYVANGWHNLGVQSLKAGDCARAVEHFKEMRAAQPSDKTAGARIELAQTCGSPNRDVAYAKAVLALEYRSIDD